jgi:hypothetical protein
LAGPAQTSVDPSDVSPWRTNEVHDSKVRRIATITPDIICPKANDFSPGDHPHRARIGPQYR